MADNRTYYYLKLKEDFFESDDMKLLQSMKDGYMYSDLLLKLYLKSLRQEGRLMYRGLIPYTPDMIAAVTGHSVATVEKALKLFVDMGIIEVLDNGSIYIMDIQNFIGQSSSEADRKRNYRKMIEAEKYRISMESNGTFVRTNVRQTSGQMTGQTSGQMSDKCPDKSPPENRDKRLEYREQSIENRDTKADSNNKYINNNILAQSSKPSSEPEADVAAIILNDGTDWRPDKALFAEYVRLYPNVDVKQQFNEMRGWCLSNPTKRKTRRGVKRFVNSWLAREQDSWKGTAGSRSGQAASNTPTSSIGEYYHDHLERMANEQTGFEEGGDLLNVE